MSTEDEIRKLLRDHGAVLIRQRKHAIYRFPDGRIFSMSSTPSARSAPFDTLRTLRRMLGIERDVTKNHDRKPKPGIDHHRLVRAGPIRFKTHWKTQLFQAMRWVEWSRENKSGNRTR